MSYFTRKLLLTAMVTALLLGLAGGTAVALRSISISLARERERITLRGRTAFRERGGTITCESVSLVSTPAIAIPKRPAATIATTTSGAVVGCTGPLAERVTGTVLAEERTNGLRHPFDDFYVSITGTLPVIASWIITPRRYSIFFEGVLTSGRCIYTSEEGVTIALRLSRGTIEGYEYRRGSRLSKTAESSGICPAEVEVEGTGTLTPAMLATLV